MDAIRQFVRGLPEFYEMNDALTKGRALEAKIMENVDLAINANLKTFAESQSAEAKTALMALHEAGKLNIEALRKFNALDGSVANIPCLKELHTDIIKGCGEMRTTEERVRHNEATSGKSIGSQHAAAREAAARAKAQYEKPVKDARAKFTTNVLSLLQDMTHRRAVMCSELSEAAAAMSESADSIVVGEDSTIPQLQRLLAALEFEVVD